MLCAALTVFLALLGACIGSFLNVVVYRLPRGLSVAQPRRSFCPSCGKQIEWHDNIPLLSWLLLKGRCRYCRLPISMQYPLVEAACVVLTVIVWHGVRSACLDVPIEQCWPVAIGMLGLFWCLLGLSAMDLEEYYVDIRLTWLAVAIGLVGHAVSPARVWPVDHYVSAGSGAFAIGCTVMLILLNWLWPMPEEQPVDQPPVDRPEDGMSGSCERGRKDADGSHAPPQGAAVPGPAAPGGGIALVWLLAILAVAIAAVEVISCRQPAEPVPGRLLIVGGLATLFGSILAASWLPTEADEAIAQAVEDERSHAVRQVAKEALALLTCVLAGLALVWLSQWGGLGRLWLSALAWEPLPHWQPVAGLLTALNGWIVAGGICWLVRVVFTMIFRKEALGFGDIHIIAAAGAVMGPHLAIAGFFLAAPVALLGTLVLAFRKRYRTLPFGPWLSMGFLLALLWGRPLVEHIEVGLGGLSIWLSGGPVRPIP